MQEDMGSKEKILLNETKANISGLKRVLFLAAALLLMLILTLGFCEIMLRIIDKPKAVYSGWKAMAKASELNQLGYRGKKIRYNNGDLVVLIVGDSQVEAPSLLFNQLPERSLERHLARWYGNRVKVFSIGAQGYGQDQEYFALKEYLEKYRADVVILWETPMNDVWNNMFPTHSAGFRKPTYYLKGNRAIGPNWYPAQRINSRIKLIALAQLFYWRYAYGNAAAKWDEKWDRKHLPPAREMKNEHSGKYSSCLQRQYNKLSHDSSGMDNEKSNYCIFETPTSSRMKYGMRLTKALLQMLIKETAKRKAAFVAFTQDNSYPCTNGVYRLNGKYYVLSKDQYWKNIYYMNQGVEFFRIPVKTKSWAVDSYHLNAVATDEVMETLSKKLVEENIFEETKR